MNTCQFELKSEAEQITYTKNKGKYVNTRFMGFHVIHLHRIKDFLVELYFDIRTQSFSYCRIASEDDLLTLLYNDANLEVKLPFLKICHKLQ
jgi:hypothetical protein